MTIFEKIANFFISDTWFLISYALLVSMTIVLFIIDDLCEKRRNKDLSAMPDDEFIACLEAFCQRNNEFIERFEAALNEMRSISAKFPAKEKDQQAEDFKCFYPYPCDEPADCYAINEDPEMSFAEYCQHYCANCPDCVFLDLPYDNSEGKSE